MLLRWQGITSKINFVDHSNDWKHFHSLFVCTVFSDFDDDWDDVEKAHSIDLLHPLPDGWKGGDTINAYPGCDKTMSTCKDKFENFKHFIGFPYAPYESIRFTGLKGQSVTASKK